ncbi:sensor histidine kinase [Marinospirillum perlucidum]|uniref:sensor histidine kinase n=1 Tax=Marinospirillum perlucidum TaxID=1982602 RepID=UPI000DF3459C|nr:7TM diverse intracellular signaling domain-containing protein [Marinospirillum perlucidum]
MRWCSGLLLVLLFSPFIQAGAAELLQPDAYYGQALLQTDYYRDASQQLTLKEVQALAASSWTPQQPDNRGFDSAAHWYRFQVHPRQPGYLVAPFTLLDRLEVYWLDTRGQVVSHQLSGDHQPLSRRPDWRKRFAFPWPEQTLLTAYVRIQTLGLANNRLLLWPADAFHHFSQREARWLSWCYGLLGGLGFFFVFIYLALRDRLFLYFGGMALSVLVMSMSIAGEFSVSHWVDFWPGLNDYLLVIWPLVTTLATILFLRSFFQLDHLAPGMVKVFYGLLGCMLLAQLQLLHDYALAYRLTFLLVLTVTPLTLAIIYLSWRRGQQPAYLILVGLAFSLVGASVDISRAFTDSLEPFLLGDYGFELRFFSRHATLTGMTLEMACFALAVAGKIFQERRAREVALEQLILAEKEQKQLQETSQQQREELLREMHDGLGSQLTTAVYSARNPVTKKEDLVAELQEALEDLRMMMDSLQSPGGNLATLLGQLRYRLGRRLQAAGLNLHWQVGDLPLEKDLTPRQALHLQRLVQEALANVIKHAQADEVRFEAHQTADRNIAIKICDNGQGFSLPPMTRGRGLDNMRYRAKALDGRLEISSSTLKKGGTCLLLLLPN